ncbi:sugar transferase [Nocardioides sp. CPCC 205120]|uniref:sugar transferase n=1 Tax=Nocardioides sp. CPCC 205120 TaxID=3406462 RepID=UPI003B50B02B
MSGVVREVSGGGRGHATVRSVAAGARRAAGAPGPEGDAEPTAVAVGTRSRVGRVRRVRRSRLVLALGEVALPLVVPAGGAVAGVLAPTTVGLVAGSWWAARVVLAGSRPTHAAVTRTDLGGLTRTVLVASGLLALAVAAGLLAAPVPVLVLPVAITALLVAVLRAAVAAWRGQPRVVLLVPSARRATPEAGGPVAPVATVGVDLDTGAAPALARTVVETRADLVLLAPGTGLAPRAVRAVTWQLQATGVPLGFTAPAVATRRLGLGRLGGPAGRTVLTVAPPRHGAAHRITKAVVDRAVGAVALVLVSPLLAVLALAVRLDSRGPALFHQVRVGRDGRPFVMHKLRTMGTDAERLRHAFTDLNESDAVLFKIRADPRVTRVGRLLRRSSLDELPQLWNVVRGDMSLVGPRPALPAEVAAYDDTARRRLAVKPGLTGLWQVSGRSDLPWSDGVDLDLAYADDLSIAGDLVICVRTVSAVLRAKGAY